MCGLYLDQEVSGILSNPVFFSDCFVGHKHSKIKIIEDLV